MPDEPNTLLFAVVEPLGPDVVSKMTTFAEGVREGHGWTCEPPMDEPTFWQLIHLLDRDVLAENEYAAVEPIIEAMSKLTPAEMASFEEHLAQRLYALDGRRFADESGESSGSDDAFLYARCFVVAQGEGHFRRVLADPTLMPKSAEWCEALLTVAPTAHERATGKPAEFATTVSYETGSNRACWE